MELAVTLLALACLLQAAVIAALAVGMTLAVGFLFRENGRLRADLERLDEVVAEQGELWKSAMQPTKEQQP